MFAEVSVGAIFSESCTIKPLLRGVGDYKEHMFQVPPFLDWETTFFYIPCMVSFLKAETENKEGHFDEPLYSTNYCSLESWTPQHPDGTVNILPVTLSLKVYALNSCLVQP